MEHPDNLANVARYAYCIVVALRRGRWDDSVASSREGLRYREEMKAIFERYPSADIAAGGRSPAWHHIHLTSKLIEESYRVKKEDLNGWSEEYLECLECGDPYFYQKKEYNWRDAKARADVIARKWGLSVAILYERDYIDVYGMFLGWPPARTRKSLAERFGDEWTSKPDSVQFLYEDWPQSDVAKEIIEEVLGVTQWTKKWRELRNRIIDIIMRHGAPDALADRKSNPITGWETTYDWAGARQEIDDLLAPYQARLPRPYQGASGVPFDSASG